MKILKINLTFLIYIHRFRWCGDGGGNGGWGGAADSEIGAKAKSVFGLFASWKTEREIHGYLQFDIKFVGK